MKTAILLHAPLGPALAPSWAGPLLQGLPYARRLRIESRPQRERWASLAGIALALLGASRASGGVPGLNALQGAAGEKPRFASGPSFSIAHSEGHVGCVVSAQAEVGLD
ncbi:MAG: hypothetical protein ACR2I8_01025, partial [Steroidobacteraceae bacterium]